MTNEYPFFTADEHYNPPSCFIPEEPLPVLVVGETDATENNGDSGNERTTPGSNNDTTISPDPFGEQGGIVLPVNDPQSKYLNDFTAAFPPHVSFETQEHIKAYPHARIDFSPSDVAQHSFTQLDTIDYGGTSFTAGAIQDHGNLTHQQDTYLYTLHGPGDGFSSIETPGTIEAGHQPELKNIPHHQLTDQTGEGFPYLNESGRNYSHAPALATAPLEQQQERNDGPITATQEVVNCGILDNEASHMTKCTEIKSGDHLARFVYNDVRPGRGSYSRSHPHSHLPSLPQTSFQPLPQELQPSNAIPSHSPLPEWPTLSLPLLQSPLEGSRFPGQPSYGFPVKEASPSSVPPGRFALRSDELLTNPLTWNEEDGHSSANGIRESGERADVAEVEEGFSSEPFPSPHTPNSEIGGAASPRNEPSPGDAIPSPSLGSMPLDCLNPREDIQDLLDMGEALRMPVSGCLRGQKRRCGEDGLAATQEDPGCLAGRAKRRKRSSRGGHQRHLGESMGRCAVFHLQPHVGSLQSQVALVPYMRDNYHLYHGRGLELGVAQEHTNVGQLEATDHCSAPIRRMQPQQGLGRFNPSVEVVQANAVSLAEVEPPAEMQHSGVPYPNAGMGQVAESRQLQDDSQLIAATPSHAPTNAMAIPEEHIASEQDAHGIERNHVDIENVLMEVASRNSMLWEETKKRKIAEVGAAKKPSAKRARAGGNQRSGSGGRSTRGSTSSTRSCYLAPPSTFCHLCTRSIKNEQLIICGNVMEGTCRKVACFKCLRELPQDWGSLATNSAWTCPHCRKACPPKAQCNTYRRVNRNRRTRGRRADNRSDS